MDSGSDIMATMLTFKQMEQPLLEPKPPTELSIARCV